MIVSPLSLDVSSPNYHYSHSVMFFEAPFGLTVMVVSWNNLYNCDINLSPVLLNWSQGCILKKHDSANWKTIILSFSTQKVLHPSFRYVTSSFSCLILKTVFLPNTFDTLQESLCSHMPFQSCVTNSKTYCCKNMKFFIEVMTKQTVLRKLENIYN